MTAMNDRIRQAAGLAPPPDDSTTNTTGDEQQPVVEQQTPSPSERMNSAIREAAGLNHQEPRP